jgi:hypothetical protein
LGLQQGEQPLHGVRVRRETPARVVPAGPERGQHLLIRGVDPGGDVVDQQLPRQHRRRAQTQERGQRVPNPAPITRIGDRGETLQQPLPAGVGQHRRLLDQHRQHRLGGPGGL